MKRSLVLLAVVAALFGVSTRADASAIYYDVQNVADAPGGPDLWQYSYYLDLGLGAGAGFRIYFAAGAYDQLELEGIPSPAEWFFPFVAQPDTGLPDAGFLDGLLIPANLLPAVQSDPFVVRFAWLGGVDGPGPQPFTLYSLVDINDPFGAITESPGGTTQLIGAPTPVPEPGTLLLLGPAIAAIARRRLRAAARRVA